jgi:hypothetical protein
LKCRRLKMWEIEDMGFEDVGFEVREVEDMGSFELI